MGKVRPATTALVQLPEITDMLTEWEAICHSDNGVELVKATLSRATAETWAKAHVGRNGITRYSLHHRQRHLFAPGGKYAEAVTHWQAA